MMHLHSLLRRSPGRAVFVALPCAWLLLGNLALGEDKTPTTTEAAQPAEVEIVEVSVAEAIAYYKSERQSLLKAPTAKGQTTAKPIVLDVRTPDEFATGHLPGAHNLDFLDDSFKVHLAKLDKSKPYLVHCAAGGRSSKVVTLMKDMGFKHLYHLKDGFKNGKKRVAQ